MRALRLGEASTACFTTHLEGKHMSGHHPTEEALRALRLGEASTTQAAALMALRGKRLKALMHAAQSVRQQGFGAVATYSRKVFIPLTTYCRDDCGYCTFKRDPGQAGAGYLSPQQVLQIATQGKALGCKEALFSLGDKPELRFAKVRQELRDLGYCRTHDYLVEICQMVWEKTGLAPHPNPGVMSQKDMALLKPFSPSMGMMLENLSPRMCKTGMPHAHAPDKVPGARLAMLRFAGRLHVPFTTGILVGIGETPEERVQALLAIAQHQLRWGNIQEVIVQNFRAKAGIPMATHPHCNTEELLAVIAVARLLLGPNMSIQAPPNLTPPAQRHLLLRAGANDWGGVSPLTPDHINPEAPWPHLQNLATTTQAAGCRLRERLTVYPKYLLTKGWVDEALRKKLCTMVDAQGLVPINGDQRISPSVN